MKTSHAYSVLARTLDHSFAYLDDLESAPVGAVSSVEELRSRLARPLNDNQIEPEKVIDDLVADATRGLHSNASGRFYGWVFGGAVPAACAADWLTTIWDQNAALYACSPASAVVEEVCGDWLKELLGLPPSASFALVTGTQMAHVTCLNAARYSLLAARGWDVERRGLNGSPRIRVLTSTERHGSLERAVRILGLGLDSIVYLPVNDNGQLSATVLRKALESDPTSPTVVALQAGDLNIGAFDSFSELIPVAKQFGAWVHVDGAFGLWVSASDRHRHFAKDIHLADSWVTDGHKWLNVPYESGYAFVADRAAHLASNSHRAEYLVHAQDARDQFDWNPEWSRRARGFATYAAIRQMGRRGIADLIDRTCRHAHSIVTRIGALPGAEMVWEPQINQGLVRFPDPSPTAGPKEHDAHTNKVIDAIVRTGEAYFTGTTWRNKRCMRVSVVNWQTNETDVERTVAAVKRVLNEMNQS